MGRGMGQLSGKLAYALISFVARHFASLIVNSCL